MSTCVCSSFQDVGFKRHQVVIGQVGDVGFCIPIAHVCFHRQELSSVLVPGNKIKGHVTLRTGWTHSQLAWLSAKKNLTALFSKRRFFSPKKVEKKCKRILFGGERNVFLLCLRHTNAHPGKEEVFRQSSCVGGWSNNDLRSLKPCAL